MRLLGTIVITLVAWNSRCVAFVPEADTAAVYYGDPPVTVKPHHWGIKQVNRKVHKVRTRVQLQPFVSFLCMTCICGNVVVSGFAIWSKLQHHQEYRPVGLTTVHGYRHVRTPSH